MFWLVIAALTWSFCPLIDSRPPDSINELRQAEQATECGKSFELRKGPDSDLTMAAEFAAHVAFQKFELDRKDVLVRVIGGWIMDCQYPKYRLFADFMASNCTRNGTKVYEPDECVAMPGAPIKSCQIYLFVQKYGASRLVTYKCREQQLNPNWTPSEFTDNDWEINARILKDLFDQYHKHQRLQTASQASHRFEEHPALAASGGISPWFLLFCALLPIAGLIILYRIW